MMERDREKLNTFEKNTARMTALTAVRTNLNEAATDLDVRVEGTPRCTSKHQQHHSRQRIIEELHPELLLNQKKKRKEKLRYKTPSLPAMIEDSSEDEESATTSDCSSSTNSLEGRSPHVLPPEERFSQSFPANQFFFSHPLISPKLGRRTTSLSLRGAKLNTGLKREFSDVIVRKKRSLSSLGERLTNISFDSLPADFLNLPPIPEAVPVKRTSEKKKSSLAEEEEEDEGASEVNATECSDCSISS